MANYPDVVPGQPVRFSAKRETAVNRLLNEADQFRAGVLRAKTSPMVRIPSWNSTQTAFKAGQVVQINVSGSMCGDAFPAIAFSSTDAVFGVCQSGLAANETGDMIISGPATVQIGGGTGSYAMPVSGGTFSRGTSGMKILHVVGTTATTGVIMMGDLNSGGGGGEYGIEATINGTTASVNLVPGGSVTSISVVPGTNVSISGGTNPNEVVVTATRGDVGFPKWHDTEEEYPIPVDEFDEYVAPFDGWVVGQIRQNESLPYLVDIYVGNAIYIGLGAAWSDPSFKIEFPILIPLKQGDHIILPYSVEELDCSGLHFVHCR